MKRILIPVLLAMTAYAAMPQAAAAEQPRPPHCERGDKTNCLPKPPNDGADPPSNQQSCAEKPRPPPPPRVAQTAQRRSNVWTRGARYSGQSVRVDASRADLSAAGAHQRWLRDGESYLLVSDRTGIIAAVRPP